MATNAYHTLGTPATGAEGQPHAQPQQSAPMGPAGGAYPGGYQAQPTYAAQPYAGQPYQAQPPYAGQQYVAGQQPYGYAPQSGPNATFVAVAMPVPSADAQVNHVWLAQQVDTTSCYVKVLATLIVAYGIYSLAVSANSMYTSGWDIASGVFVLVVGLIGVAAGFSNRTGLARAYFWALVALTAVMALGFVIVLAVIGANPCKDVADHTDDDRANRVCDYSVATIRAVLVISALVVVGCCLCCTVCARMHLKNLELRDTNGVPRT